MATYKKPLKSIEVITDCETFSVADTVEKAIASSALADFLGDKSVITLITGENETTYVRSGAICAIKETVTTEDVEKADPYGCVEETETPVEP